ncbi:GNAT family N-acetyltransferase [Paraferrimonas sp. SM1919]|uniref:GNAT family N-acetyltransferase n=1 Tax=Paraferrimonas sp. SM1919 TaxID=2662263 RepID=UPI0013D759F2|nr:GNAT family N-acetyltransferase [Paraferrimonas sp. SM1919]
MEIINLQPKHYQQLVSLANKVHGSGYISLEELRKKAPLAIKNGINSNFVAMEGDRMLGFRLTYAPGNWQADKWCSPDLWCSGITKLCYFKCNTVDFDAQGKGIGGQLLMASIKAVKAQGGVAGISHLWKESPNNAAVRYFSKAGGTLIKAHPKRWNEEGLINNYDCPICGFDCQCTAMEMQLKFEDLV